LNAAYLVAHGGPEVLRYGSLPDPQPGPGEVRVAVEAAALNHLDLWVRNGIPGVEVRFPRIPGADGTGRIEALGPGAAEVLRKQPATGGRQLAEGDRIVIDPGLSCGACEFCARGDTNLCIRYRLIGEHTDGTLAELVVVPATNVYPAPERLTPEQCAAFPLVYLTAWRMVRVRGRLRPGETVLIHGVGGGVAGAALQIAVAAGARVLATSSSPAKLDRARALGAERAVDHGREDVRAAVREWTAKRGVDLVIDTVGGPAWSLGLDAVARGGRLVTSGATAGVDPPARINRIFWKQVDVLGSTMGSRADFLTLLDRLTAGELGPIVDSVFPLSRAADAMARLEAGAQFGKIVLRVSSPAERGGRADPAEPPVRGPEAGP
jgi:NADPH:quinone reductase-like Zn-dependent oxidoreductase